MWSLLPLFGNKGNRYTQYSLKRSRLLVSFVSVLSLSVATSGLVGSFAQSYPDQKKGLKPFEEDYELKLLGKFIFFDNISNPAGLSCASCHDPRTGGTGPTSAINESQVAMPGANPHSIGSLKPPSNAYATMIPPFRDLGFPKCNNLLGFCGGNFWNGRSVGYGGDVLANSTAVVTPAVLGAMHQYEKYLGPTADQALNPFTNSMEHNMSVEAVCKHVENEKYSALYRLAWKEPIKCDAANVEVSFKRIAVALSAYQASSDINSFSSKRDYALKRELDGVDVDDTPGGFPLVGFTDQENYGHDLFFGIRSEINPDGKDAQCSVCHLSDKEHPDGTGLLERYADDAFHNIGTPKNYKLTNLELPGGEGLAGHTGDPSHIGARKAPTLRNVDKRPSEDFVKAYGANGWFKSLESITHFYNTSFLGNCVITEQEDCTDQDEITYEETTAAALGITRCRPSITEEREALQNNCWPAAEFPDTIAPTVLLGDLRLNLEDEAALVAYMKTFTDEYTAQPPQPRDLEDALLLYPVDD